MIFSRLVSCQGKGVGEMGRKWDLGDPGLALMGIVQRERLENWIFGELCLKWLPISFNTGDKKVKMINWEKRALVKQPEVWTLGRKRHKECRNMNLWPSDVQEPLAPADVSISSQLYIQGYLGGKLKSATPRQSTTVTNQALSFSSHSRRAGC